MGHVPRELCDHTISLDLSDCHRMDSLINQESTQLISQLHPESNVCPMSHARRYLHLRSYVTLIHGLCHLLIIYRIIWWGWNHVPNECANIYKLYSTQK